MSDNLSNGHPQPDSKLLPRVAPPEGQRAARGSFSASNLDEVIEEEIVEDFPNQEIGDSSSNKIPDEANRELTPQEKEDQEWYAELAANKELNPEANPENGSGLTVADVPAIEDSYEPPLGLDTSSGYGGGGSGTDGADYADSGDDSSDYVNPNRRPDTPKDVELGLMEHLNELRVRLLRCAVILMAGMALTWSYSKPLQDWFANPINLVLKDKGILISTNPTGFFSITVQFSMVSALIIMAPFLFWQVWRFIEPALTNSERRYSMILVPFSSVLFFLGAGLGYAVSPLFFKFFLAFQPTGVAANWDYYESILLMAKMLLVFGVAFQVPIIVIFLNKLGILSRNVLIEYWRHAVVLIFVVVAVLTPTWDPVTLAVCATPPCFLYALSIWLVKWL